MTAERETETGCKLGAAGGCDRPPRPPAPSSSSARTAGLSLCEVQPLPPPEAASRGARCRRQQLRRARGFSLPVRRKRLADAVLLAEKIRPEDHEQATRCLMLKKSDHVPSVRGDCEASRKVPACRALPWCCPSTDPPEWPITRYKINLPPWDPFESNPSSPQCNCRPLSV